MGVMGEELEQVDEPIDDADIEQKRETKLLKNSRKLGAERPEPVKQGFFQTKRTTFCSQA